MRRKLLGTLAFASALLFTPPLTVGADGRTETSVTLTKSNVTVENSVATLAYDDNVTLSFSAESTAPEKNDNGLKINAADTKAVITVTGANGVIVSSVKFTYRESNSKYGFLSTSTTSCDPSTSNATLSSDGSGLSWTGINAQTAILTIGDNTSAISADGKNHIYLATVTVTYTTSSSSGGETTTKKDLTATFSSSELTCTSGEMPTAPTLTIKDGESELSSGYGTVTYSSDKSDVLSVNSSTGVLGTAATVTEATTVTITATVAENDTYNSTTASYTVTVNPASSSGDDTPSTSTSTTWNFSNWFSGSDKDTITTTTTYDGLTVYASSKAYVIIENNSKTVDDVAYTKRLKLNGTGSLNGDSSTRVLKFTAKGACTIEIVAASGKSGNTRNLVVATTNAAVDTLSFDGASKQTCTYTGSGEYIYIYSAGSGINLYAIKVTPISVHSLDASTYTVQSLYLGFDATIPDGVTAYWGELNSDNSAVTLHKINGTVLPKETGVIVEANATGKYTFTETTDAATDDVTSNSLKGVTENTNVSDLQTANSGMTILTFGQKNSEYGFRNPANTYIAANKVYLPVSSSPQGVIGLSFDDDTSSINPTDLIGVKTPMGDTPAYNMMGQRVGANAKGLIIKGGRKYVVK